MDKTAIITVTQGDFEYIDEWITYHHNLGVDLIVIGYNGDSKDFGKLKKYDYVVYFDFSVNDLNKDIIRNTKWVGWFKNGKIYNMGNHQKFLNILFDYVRWIRQDIHYTIMIDTDEFVDIKNPNYTNISDFLNDKFEETNSSKSLIMTYYGDNNLVYKDGRNCIERFTSLGKFQNDNNCHSKIIINNHHIHVHENNMIYVDSPHTVSLSLKGFNFDISDITLRHYFTKSLEEWIEKMNPEIDSDYFRRFRGKVFSVFFDHNEMTKEKLEAIPVLLKKYNIDYDFLNEEPEEFKTEYNRIMNN